jgi:DNA adenine methylase
MDAKPLVSWPGGKRRLARKILPYFTPHTCYVEPFAGAAGMLFSKPEQAKVEVINDINSDLVCLYRVVQHHLEEFVRQFKYALVSREMFRWCNLQNVQTLTDIQRAARFFYLQQLTFGGKVEGRTFGTATTTRPINFLRIEESLSQAHLRLSQVVVECLPWQLCVSRYDRPHTLFFCDPPYWDTAGYDVPFEIDQYQQLAEALRDIKGQFVLTINDHPMMRSVFSGFRMDQIETTYTMGLAGKKTPRFELIVHSKS